MTGVKSSVEDRGVADGIEGDCFAGGERGREISSGADEEG